ncbi:MAG: adenylate kinase [Acidimicrobiia bacterium]|nr:adenylate kinase [Acidimicrobiia bacterium]
MTRGPRLVFLGKQGSGKGTQAEILAADYGVTHLSTGEIFRTSADEGSSLGLEAKAYMDRGELVPDETVVKIVEEHFARHDTTAKGFILDGFPRTHNQAVELRRILGDNTLDAVIDIDVPDAVVLERMIERGREDDTAAAMKRRLELYRRETQPLAEFYGDQNLLERVDGLGEVGDITKRIAVVVDERFDPTRP